MPPSQISPLHKQLSTTASDLCPGPNSEATGFTIFIDRVKKLDITLSATKEAADECLHLMRLAEKTLMSPVQDTPVTTKKAGNLHSSQIKKPDLEIARLRAQAQEAERKWNIPRIKLWKPSSSPPHLAAKPMIEHPSIDVCVDHDYRYPWETKDEVYEQRKRRERDHAEMDQKWREWKEKKLVEKMQKKKSLANVKSQNLQMLLLRHKTF